MNKEYNVNADVFTGFDFETVFGRVKDFEDKSEFIRYLIGEEYIDIDKNNIDIDKIEIIYMRYIPKGNFQSDYNPCYNECEKGKGALEWYLYRLGGE